MDKTRKDHLWKRFAKLVPAVSAREYILTIPETQMLASQVIQPVQQSKVVSRGQQQPRGQQTSYLDVDDQ